MARIFSIINYKGGVGKTTTTYHIGTWLALNHGKKVLLVDVDPQTNLTFLCATPERWQDFRDNTGTIASLYRAHLDDKPFNIRDIVWSKPIEKAGKPVVPGLDLVPSDVELLSIDLDLQASSTGFTRLEDAATQHITKRAILSNALQEVADEYDYILIDCPPNLYLVTQNALAVSEAYIVTALPDHLSTIGLEILYDRIKKLNNLLTYASAISGGELKGPDLGGIIFVRVRLGGTKITKAHVRKMAEIKGDYGPNVFEEYTTEGIGYGEASERALPVFLIDDANAKRVADQYRKIGDEFLARFP
ncbi:ParA family protein [Polyangium fumosum]|uniref:ParA family protein n=1 Tax=Polyangium fumosum TaxID=889272 RepID=A0A4U1IQB2_9BACT|nr:AAA family ATPase [Polyangium fumosum]TKC96409.1 ParA family protein [Polyangium fumosum]